MKTIILIMLFPLFCITAIADDSKTNLIVWQTDGSCVLYDLDECPKTTFEGDNLIITTTKISIEYPMAKVARYTFESSNTGINNPQDHQGITVKQTEKELIVCHLPKGKKASVYTVDGKLLATALSSGQVETILPLRLFSTGTYIIKTDDITYKIMKR
jgi:hypothetical protein